MTVQKELSAQKLPQPDNNSCQINARQVWSQLTPTQQQLVLQSLVLICQHLLQQISQTSQPEVQDE